MKKIQVSKRFVYFFSSFVSGGKLLVFCFVIVLVVVSFSFACLLVVYFSMPHTAPEFAV